MVWDRKGPRRVTQADFRAIDEILDSAGLPLPSWALAQIKSIVKRGVPDKLDKAVTG